MPFEAAKCPNCAAAIQVPTDVEHAKCMYCGSTLVVKDAIQKLKIELSGSVIVDSNIESMLKSAEGFLTLEKWAESEKLFTKITEQNSTDYRGWWGLFLVKTHNMKLYNSVDSIIDISDADSAIEIAPEKAKIELKLALSEYKKNNPKMFRLRINRSHQMTGLLASMNIKINDVKYLSILSGGTCMSDVPEGIYEIKFSCIHKTIVAFEIHNDVSINIRLSSGVGKILVQVQGANIISEKVY